MTQWDIKPPGYENITAEQAKMAHLFVKPGDTRAPATLEAVQAANIPKVNSSAVNSLHLPNSRQAKRLFVYNLPSNTSEADLVNFFNLQMNGISILVSSDPCLSATLSPDKSFAMLMFKNPGDSSIAMTFDGIAMAGNDNMETSNGTAGLSIRRPSIYLVAKAKADPEQPAGVVYGEVPDTSEKLLVSGLQPFLTEDQVLQLLGACGTLRSLALAKDTSSGESRVSIIKILPIDYH